MQYSTTMRAQSGVEYLALFGVVAVITLVVSYYFYGNFQVQAQSYQASTAVERLANSIDSVAAQGAGSSAVVTVYFPPGLLNATASGREVLFRLSTN